MQNLEYSYGRGDHSAFRTSEYVFHQLIPYIGSKRKLLGLINQAIAKTGGSANWHLLRLVRGQRRRLAHGKKAGFSGDL